MNGVVKGVDQHAVLGAATYVDHHAAIFSQMLVDDLEKFPGSEMRGI